MRHELGASTRAWDFLPARRERLLVDADTSSPFTAQTAGWAGLLVVLVLVHSGVLAHVKPFESPRHAWFRRPAGMRAGQSPERAVKLLLTGSSLVLSLADLALPRPGQVGVPQVGGHTLGADRSNAPHDLAASNRPENSPVRRVVVEA